MGCYASGSGSFVVSKEAVDRPSVVTGQYIWTNRTSIQGLLEYYGFEVVPSSTDGSLEVTSFDGKWSGQEGMLGTLAQYLEGDMEFRGEDGEEWGITIHGGVLDNYNPKAENEKALGEYKKLITSMFESGNSEVMDWIVKNGLGSESRIIKAHVSEMVAASASKTS